MRKLLCICAFASVAAFGAAPAQTATAQEITFTPPAVGAPGNRTGAATRGGTADTAGVTLLAPSGGGMTADPQPTLFWWLDRPFRGELNISFGASDAGRPLLDSRESVELPAGQHAFALSDYGLRLVAGTIYRWSVVLTPADGGARLSGSSYIEVATATPPAGADTPVAKASRQAAAGNWYDAFALVATDPALADQRAALLKQVGIELDAP